MKCPYCDYFYGWDDKLMIPILPKAGHFWELPVKFERLEGFDSVYKILCACPMCGKTFIEV